MLSNVTTKGQVTIPAEIRNRFHIRPNDRVDFFVDGERIIITPVRTLKQLRGSVAAAGSGDFAMEREDAKRSVAERVAGENS
jgi:AbrB family looped-hinge helix DNA binding protein